MAGQRPVRRAAAAGRSFNGVRGAVLALALVASATACGGGPDEPRAVVTVTAEPTPSTDPAAVNDPAAFVALNPGCDDVAAWYTRNPADVSVDIAALSITECGAVPPAVGSATRLNEIDPAVLALLLGPQTPAGSPGRKLAEQLLADHVCSQVNAGDLNLWVLDRDLRQSYDLDAATAADLVASKAAERC
jgi:hypothetical protein